MTVLPPELIFGKVIGRFLLAVADGSDPDSLPDAVAAQGTIKFTPKTRSRRVSEDEVALVSQGAVICNLDAEGNLIDAEDNVGVWLITGVYRVTYNLLNQSLRGHYIEVLPGNDADHPIDLADVIPPVGPILTNSQYAELIARIALISDVVAPDLSGYITDDEFDVEIAAREAGYDDLDGRVQILEADSGPDLSEYATDAELTAGLSEKAASVHTHTSGAITDWTEAVQDALAGFFNATGATFTYNDAGDEIVVAVSGGSGDPELMRDTIGAALVGLGNITVTPNDVGDTITITTTATVNSTDAALRDRTTHTGEQAISTIIGLQAALTAESTARAAVDSDLDGRITTLETAPGPDLSGYATDSELTTGLAGKSDTGHTHTSGAITDWTEAVQDALASFFNATGATFTYNDATNEMVVAITGQTGDPETMRDTIGAALIPVGNIGVTVNDAGDTITISTTATVNSTDAALRDRTTHTGAQDISTINGLQAALDAKAASLGSDDNYVTDTEKAALHTHPAVIAQGTTQALARAAIDAAPATQTIDSKTANYTLVLTDANKVLEMNSALGLTLNIPTDASVAFPVGTRVDVVVVGAGMVTVAAVTPGTTTVNGTPSLVSRAQWSGLTLLKRAANLWVVIGDLA